ncbi:MAG: L,D-transpeptidase family protein [Streptosporangiales bacterium]|nr:L,D-transpeptidase family protein [Streptosporangiales bacterium]
MSGMVGSGDEAVPGPAEVAISPLAGEKDRYPERPITVRAQGGTLKHVVVRNDGREVAGTYDAKRTSWSSTGNLEPSTTYAVTARAVNAAGQSTTATSSFKTLKPEKTAEVVNVTPASGETVGVGMPIIVDFDRPIRDKAAVERALRVKSSKAAKGAWHWVTDEQVVFRTSKYWKAKQKVRFRGLLSGVRTGKDTYGVKDVKRSFKIGPRHISEVDTDSHMMTVKSGRKTLREIPISAGKATQYKYTTTNGVHLAMERAPVVVMDSATVGIPQGSPDYYRQTVYSAVRISNSGEYVHGAPWSVGSQGYANVSHGCVNASPSNARWFLGWTQLGDIIEVTGTHRELEYNNGWGFWQMSFKNWVKGGALDRVISTGPKKASSSKPTPTPTPTPTGTAKAEPPAN